MTILRTVNVSELPVTFHHLEKQKVQQDLGLHNLISCSVDPKSEAEHMYEKVNHAFERALKHGETWAVTDYGSIHKEESFASQIGKGDKVIIFTGNRTINLSIWTKATK